MDREGDVGGRLESRGTRDKGGGSACMGEEWTEGEGVPKRGCVD